MTINQLRALKVGDKVKITRDSLSRFFGNNGVVTISSDSRRINNLWTEQEEPFVRAKTDRNGADIWLFANEMDKLE